MSNSASGPLPGVLAERNGRPVRRIEDSNCWIEVLTEGGPRIVGFGLSGRPNFLAETPDARWDAGHGMYELIGGHRLWTAPESPECSTPDQFAPEITAVPNGIRLTGAVEKPTGLRKTMQITFVANGLIWIKHEIENAGDLTHTFSLWPITQLRPGGVASVPLPAAVDEHVVTPNQLIVLWPYCSWNDPRLSLGVGELAIRSGEGKPFKLGCLSSDGDATYRLEGLTFTKAFNPAVRSPHADFGCNVEIYTDQGGIEIESLSPLVTLAPGDTTVWQEQWELTAD